VRAKVEANYERFPALRDKRRQVTGELSGGQQRMVEIGRTLMSEPRMLLVDEPTAGLSKMLAEEVYEMLTDLARIEPRGQRGQPLSRLERPADGDPLVLELQRDREGDEPRDDQAVPRNRSLAAGVVRGGAAAWVLAAPLRGRERPPAPVADASRSEREMIYEAIRDLDHDLDTGKIDAEDHAEMRARLRADAIELVRRERAAQAPATETAVKQSNAACASAPDAKAEAKPTSGAFCPSCGGRTEPHWRFCSHCGAELEAS